MLPEIIQIIPTIEAKSQGVFLKAQSTKKFLHSLWCALQGRHLQWDKLYWIIYLVNKTQNL